ncbi:MAG: hypothetical protein ACYCQJ_01490 [Nitrososphaerales archaeon]
MLASEMKQNPSICEWCGKFIVLISSSSPEMKVGNAPYEFYLDDMGRLVKDDNDLFLISKEHRCKVTCSKCGKLVVIEDGKIYEKALELAKAPHKC